MPIIDVTGRKSWKIRWLLVLMYALLICLGVTMVYPFLITMTASVATPVDYHRYDAWPKWLRSRDERFVRALVPYFPEGMRGGIELLPSSFVGVPTTWTNWQEVGKDRNAVRGFAQGYLDQADDPERFRQLQAMAADYQRFASQYDVNDMVCTFDSRDVPRFFRNLYRAEARSQGDRHDLDARGLDILSKHWGVPFTTFFEISAGREMNKPMDQPRFYPPQDARAKDFLNMQEAYRHGRLLPRAFKASWLQFLQDQSITLPVGRIPFPVTAQHDAEYQQLWEDYLSQYLPLSNSRPFVLKPVWLAYLGSPQVRQQLALAEGGAITLEEYNKSFRTEYAAFSEIPFPPTPVETSLLQQVWRDFVQTRYPLRLIEIHTSPAIHDGYRAFVQARLKGSLARYNVLLNSNLRSWEELRYPARMPDAPEDAANLWMDYAATLPFEVKIPHSADDDFQQFVLKQYGSLQAINQAYGAKYAQLEELVMPFDAAYLITFLTMEPKYTQLSIGKNYAFVFDYLVLRGRSVFNTLVLVVLALLGSLTVNPLAAYALSRFQLRQTQSVILFLLATMAFPAAVTMIPGYLLMRDLQMLNTYWALILPGLANGMSIFLLKGFFDSLPPELYEAAMLDGCPEWVMFLRITLPLSKPILAVTALNSFIAAYNGWEWALIVCQKQEMWTLSVWLYQFNALFVGSMPWTVMASFLIASIPTLLVFLFCQNIILRGIILPQMK